MFKESSDAPPAANTGGEETVSSSYVAKLTEDEIIAFTGKWNLMVAYSLLDLEGFVFNAENLKRKMGISSDEASVVIESLSAMGLVVEGSEGGYSRKPLFFNDTDMPASDVLNNTLKVKRQSIERLTSKDVCGFHFDVFSRKVIDKYFYEFYGLLQKIAEESKGANDCEVYGFDFSFAKATETRKVK